MINISNTKIKAVDLPRVRGDYRESYNISQNSWFNCGGKCDVFFKPKDVDDLHYFLENYDKSISITTIGALSNTLIRDGGYRGVIIKLGREFADIKLQNNIIQCGSAVLDYNLANFALENSISGFEFLIGIPGSVGGNVIMNAGCYGSEISEIFTSLTGFSYDGEYKIISKKDVNFVYRSSNLNNIIITNVDFAAKKSYYNQILKKNNEIKAKRDETHPIKQKTCGSTFKNPTSNDVLDTNRYAIIPKAWELIKNCIKNDKGGDYKIGGAFFSTKHYNFMINDGTATASDIENLGNYVQKKVLEDCGVYLKWEIKFIGEFIDDKN